MGYTESRWSNIAAESCCSTFKNEQYHRRTCTTLDASRSGPSVLIDGRRNFSRALALQDNLETWAEVRRGYTA